MVWPNKFVGHQAIKEYCLPKAVQKHSLCGKGRADVKKNRTFEKSHATMQYNTMSFPERLIKRTSSRHCTLQSSCCALHRQGLWSVCAGMS